MLFHINIRPVQKILIYCTNLLNPFNFYRNLYAFLNHVFMAKPSLNLSISKYIFVHVNSETNAGGVAMYIRDILEFKIYQKQHQLTNSEALWIKINNLTEFSTNIAVVCKHPNSSTIDEFIKDYLAVSPNSTQTKKYFIYVETLASISSKNRTLSTNIF